MCDHSLPLVVGERDALRRHFEVDDGGGRRRIHGQRHRGRLLDRLVSRQRLQRHRAQVPHVTRYTNNTQAHKIKELESLSTNFIHWNTTQALCVLIMTEYTAYTSQTNVCGVCVVPAPCLRSSAAEFVAVCADESLSSSTGSASINRTVTFSHLADAFYPKKKTKTHSVYLCQAGWVYRAEPEGWWSADTPEQWDFLSGGRKIKSEH